MGSPQTIQCIPITSSGLIDDLVMFTWIGPGGNTLPGGDRLTINPPTPSGNNFSSSIRLSYLIEGDEGDYTCNVTTFGMTGSATVMLESLNGIIIFLTSFVLCSIIY